MYSSKVARGKLSLYKRRKKAQQLEKTKIHSINKSTIGNGTVLTKSSVNHRSSAVNNLVDAKIDKPIVTVDRKQGSITPQTIWIYNADLQNTEEEMISNKKSSNLYAIENKNRSFIRGGILKKSMDGWYITYEKMRCNFSINFSVPETAETGRMIVKRMIRTKNSVSFLKGQKSAIIACDNLKGSNVTKRSEASCLATANDNPWYKYEHSNDLVKLIDDKICKKRVYDSWQSEPAPIYQDGNMSDNFPSTNTLDNPNTDISSNDPFEKNPYLDDYCKSRIKKIDADRKQREIDIARFVHWQKTTKFNEKNNIDNSENDKKYRSYYDRDGNSYSSKKYHRTK